MLVRVVRGETVESLHRGHFVVMDGDKNKIAEAGDPSTVTYFRSACKAMQALPFVASGGADRFGFSVEELALACASHSGEPMHVNVAASMLEKAGFTEGDLRCGTHVPFSDSAAETLLRAGEKPTQLHNNCSGKHATMLAFAKHTGADPATYDSIDNPIQQEILRTMAMFAELPISSIAIGVDGCSAPNFALPITAMARCFANLINPPDSFGSAVHAACKRLVAAMIAHPELVGGTDRLDTILMKAAPGRLISKVGADGVWLCGVLPSDQYPSGLSIALKIEDGDDKRARPVAAVEILRQLRILSDADLKQFSPMQIRTRRGEVAGEIRAILNGEI